MNISKHVYAYEIIEVNILMPKEWFNQDNLYHYPERTYTKEQIINEEPNWQEDYDKYTTEYVKKEATPQVIAFILFFNGWSTNIVAIFYLVNFWQRYSRK